MKTSLLATLAAWVLGTGLLGAAPLKVATLHPLIADLARQVGGDRVEVVEVLKPGGDIHHFEPAPKDLAAMNGAKLLLASGKGLESFLPKVRDSLGNTVKLVEVGEKVPSIPFKESGAHHDDEEEEHDEKEHAKKSGAAKDDDHDHDHHHHHGDADPHWWHSAENMKRAARILAEEFTAADAAGAATYDAGARAVAKKMTELKSWAQKEISVIPREDRKLVTAHAAFGYFCKEYGFEPLSVLGIGRGDDANPRHIAQTIHTIQEEKIRAVFPEDQANPKVLAEIVRSTGVKTGGTLIADGTALEAHTFEAMLRHNVKVIVEALKP